MQILRFIISAIIQERIMYSFLIWISVTNYYNKDLFIHYIHYQLCKKLELSLIKIFINHFKKYGLIISQINNKNIKSSPTYHKSIIIITLQQVLITPWEKSMMHGKVTLNPGSKNFSISKFKISNFKKNLSKSSFTDLSTTNSNSTMLSSSTRTMVMLFISRPFANNLT